MNWTVIYTSKAQKDLEKLPDNISKRIILKLDEIAMNPYDTLEKMTNSPYYKFRIGNYRVIVDVVNDKLVLHVIKAMHRSSVYR